MKITIVVGSFPTVSETFIVNQIVSLIDKGHRVEIFSYVKSDLDKVHNIIKKYDLLNLVTYKSVIPQNKLKRLLKGIGWLFINFFKLDWFLVVKSLNFFTYGKKALNFELFYEAKWFLFKEKPAIIHVHFGVHAVPIANLKAKGFLSKSKLVVSFHGFDINPSKIEFYKEHYKTLFNQVDSITVNTIYTKNILLKVNSELNNIHLLPVGLDIDLFKNLNRKRSKKFKIVYCGRLVPFKGSLLLPKILNELKRRGYKNIHLTIIGEGTLKQKLIEEIAKYKISKSIDLLGAVKQQEIVKIFSSSNVFLLPGVYEKDGRAENQGLVIQEAQAMQLPVVVSDVGGMKYGLIPNETGFVVKENDISGFADALEFLMNNPEKAKIMGKKGREFVAENYDAKILVQNLIEIYKS